MLNTVQRTAIFVGKCALVGFGLLLIAIIVGLAAHIVGKYPFLGQIFLAITIGWWVIPWATDWFAKMFD